MKIRNGFVSNSSSSSFIVYGFSSDDSDKVYKLIVDKLLKENPILDRDDMYENIEEYLNNHGLNFFHYDWDWKRPDIGYRLEEGSKDKFNRSLEKAETVFKKFDEDHNTNFTKNAIVYSYCSM